MRAQPDSGVVRSDHYVVIWFHPQGPGEQSFKTEAEARQFATRMGIREWHPILEHQTIVSRVLPL